MKVSKFLNKEVILGIAFTALIASISYFIALLPILKVVGPMATAIIIAILYRNLVGYPERLKAGIQFTARFLLRLAIVLYGLRLNMQLIFEDGISLLFKGSLVILVSVVLMLVFANLLKANKELSFLVGIGTGICGAAAIAAVGPIIKAKEENIAMSVGIIALMGTIVSVFYTIIRPVLPLTSESYGIWSGLSLHELAHVALAAAPAGEDALAIALLAKLGRVFLLIPVCFGLLLWVNRKYSGGSDSKLPFPLFLVGFLLMSILNSYFVGQGKLIPLDETFLNGIAAFASFLLTMAMVALGLSIDFESLRKRALKPLLAVVVTSLIISGITFFIS